MANRFLLGLSGLGDGDRSRSGGIGFGGEGCVDQGSGGLDGNRLRDANGNHGLTGETLGLDVLVGGDHDGACGRDLRLGQLVLDAHLTVGLDLDGKAALGRSLLERLLRHEGVGNARGAACGSDDVVLLCHVPSLLLVHPFGAF